MKSSVKIPTTYLKNPLHCLALGFGTGLLPKAPGTFGTLAGIPFYFAFAGLAPMSYALMLVFMSLAGVGICHYTSMKLRVHDHPGIVFDEIVGYLITLFMLPFNPLWMLAGFVAFRFFDILKPWPISWLDKRVHGGVGIMLDDILAGVLACASLHLIRMVTGW